jgi:hypothetical protein
MPTGRVLASDETALALAALGSGLDRLDRLLECEIFPRRIRSGGRRMIQQMAQIDEMLVTGRPLGKLDLRPFLDNRRGSHCGGREGH